jgi:hypothetical protein
MYISIFIPVLLTELLLGRKTTIVPVMELSGTTNHYHTMFLQQIALISETDRIRLDQLVVVGAALQRQASRDLAPIWGINGTVDVFSSLDQMPLGYWPLIIRDKIPFGARGIHLQKSSGQPFGLAEYSPNWTLTLSHECLELLVDPFGNRLVAGDSVAPGQGRVQYLVEICDPCESDEFAYTVNGVMVSDFYTPAYFDPLATFASGVRYSMQGSILRPRQVLDGGYLSWIDPTTGNLWQMFVDDTLKTVKDRGPLPSNIGTLRGYSDRLTAQYRQESVRLAEADHFSFIGLVEPMIDRFPTPVDAATRANAESLHQQIEEIIASEAG